MKNAFGQKLGYKIFITWLTLREKEELIKIESFESQKHVVDNFSMHRNFTI